MMCAACGTSSEFAGATPAPRNLPPLPAFCKSRPLPDVEEGQDARVSNMEHRAFGASANRRADRCEAWINKQVRAPLAQGVK